MEPRVVPFVDFGHELGLYLKAKLPLCKVRNIINLMSTKKSQWVIRLDSEQVKGPYSTEAIIKMITSGVFSGNEEISTYPDGEWNA